MPIKFSDKTLEVLKQLKTGCEEILFQENYKEDEIKYKGGTLKRLLDEKTLTHEGDPNSIEYAHIQVLATLWLANELLENSERYFQDIENNYNGLAKTLKEKKPIPSLYTDIQKAIEAIIGQPNRNFPEISKARPEISKKLFQLIVDKAALMPEIVDLIEIPIRSFTLKTAWNGLIFAIGGKLLDYMKKPQDFIKTENAVTAVTEALDTNFVEVAAGHDQDVSDNAETIIPSALSQSNEQQTQL